MTREQVQLLLGTPLLRDPFHANRWDYTFNTARNGVIENQRSLTLYFTNNQLARAEGDAIEYAVKQVQAEQAAVQAEQATSSQTEQPQATPEPIFQPEQ